MWATVCCAALLRYLGNGFIAALRLGFGPRRRPLHAERICVYRIGAIGDLVCATPALFAIHRAYPEAHLTLSPHLEDTAGHVTPRNFSAEPDGSTRSLPTISMTSEVSRTGWRSERNSARESSMCGSI